jgi:hypothetical protein
MLKTLIQQAFASHPWDFYNFPQALQTNVRIGGLDSLLPNPSAHHIILPLHLMFCGWNIIIKYCKSQVPPLDIVSSYLYGYFIKCNCSLNVTCNASNKRKNFYAFFSQDGRTECIWGRYCQSAHVFHFWSYWTDFNYIFSQLKL